MASIAVQQGYVKSLQVFFEDFISHGSRSSRGNMSKMHLRRPEAAAPKSVSPLIRERMKAWLAAPRKATSEVSSPSVSAIIQQTHNEPKRGSVTNTKLPTTGQIFNPNDDFSASLEVGDNAEKSTSANALVRHRQVGKSNLGQSAASISSIVVPTSPSYVKVDSMVIDNDPYMLKAIQQATQEATESTISVNETAALEIGQEHQLFSASTSGYVDALNSPERKTRSSPSGGSKTYPDELDEHALFCARLVQDFNSEGNAEIHGRRGDTIVAYEVNDEGWCLVRNGDEFGWIPQAYLELIYPDDAKAPSPFEIDYRLCVPRPEDRQTVLEFIENSLLFSEARAQGNVEVFTDMVDQILRGGRTITATLAALLELDRNRRNFPDMKSLAASVKQLRDRWDKVLEQAQELVQRGAIALFSNPRVMLSSYQILQLITATTSGSQIIDRLQEEITKKPRYAGFDELMGAITQKERALAKAKEVKCEQGCQTVFATLRRPDLRLFKGFIDLRPNPVIQLLYNGMDADQIISSLEKLASEGKTFDSLENMMTAVYTSTGRDASILCMGQGGPISKARHSSVNPQQMTPQQSLQANAKIIMTALSVPDIQLFAALDSHVSVKMADISSLLAANPSVTSILCNIGLLNWQGRHLSSFQDLIALQSDASLLQEKQKVQTFLNDNAGNFFSNLSTDQIGMPEVELFMSQSAAYGRFIQITQQVCQRGGKFQSVSDLASAVCELFKAVHVERQKQITALGAWFASNAVFSKQVELYDESMEQLLDNAGSADRLFSALQHFSTNGIVFESIDALQECLMSFVKTLDSTNTKG